MEPSGSCREGDTRPLVSLGTFLFGLGRRGRGCHLDFERLLAEGVRQILLLLLLLLVALLTPRRV